MPSRNTKLRTIDRHATYLCSERHVADDDRRRAPVCPKCKIEMDWFQSNLKRDNGQSRIVHSFYCSHCSRTGTTEEPAPSFGPPDLRLIAR